MDRRIRRTGVAIAAAAILLFGIDVNLAAATLAQGDEPVDFIRFNGAVYLASTYLAEVSPSVPYVPLDPSGLGPAVGEVLSNKIDAGDEGAYPNEPCYWNSPDGTAPLLMTGDDIYAVRGYSTLFRIAAQRDGEVIAYQVWCNDEAEVGADLFDIYARVQRISLTADLSESSGWAIIDDPVTLDALTVLLLSGRVMPEEEMSTAPITYQLIVHLDDGSTFRASVADGEFLWGLGAIAVPAEFDEALDTAWSATGRPMPPENGA
jgi:hypothetical protein